MAYIVLVGILVGLILPIWSWSKWRQALPVELYTGGREKGEEIHGVWKGVTVKKKETVAKKKEVIYLVKRLLHRPRMPCYGSG